MLLVGDRIYMGQAGEQIERIPPANWVVDFDVDQGQYFLKRMKPFGLPKKLYGDVEAFSKKVIRSYKKKSDNLGVLLNGFKGTGKSLLAKHICLEAVNELNMPVIMITSPCGGPRFLSFLDTIVQPCVVFVDEFEKVYKDDDGRNVQDRLLSVLDGAFSSKFLFLLTINEVNKMNEFFLNRPGRLHYKKDFYGLPNKVIEEVCADLLEDEGMDKIVLDVCNLVGDVSMDIVVSTIWELNEYPDHDVNSLMCDMNLQKANSYYTVMISQNDVNIARIITWNSESPYDKNVSISWSRWDLLNPKPLGDNELRTFNYMSGEEECTVRPALAEASYGDDKECEDSEDETEPVACETACDEVAVPSRKRDAEKEPSRLIASDITSVAFHESEAKRSTDMEGNVVLEYEEKMRAVDGIVDIKWKLTYRKRTSRW